MFFQDREIKYSIRKLSVATVSLAIGFLFAPASLGATQVTHADELAVTERVEQKPESQVSAEAGEISQAESSRELQKSAEPAATETSQATDSTAFKNAQSAAATVQPATANASLNKSTLENYLKNLRSKDFSSKTDDSVEILNGVMTAADSLLQTATKQEEIDKVYRNLVTFVNSGLRNKKPKIILGKDKIPSKEVESGDTSSKGKLPENSTKQTDTIYRVEYKFTNSTPVYPLPNKIRDMLPAGTDFVARADDYKDASKLDTSTVTVPTGTWTFHGFDADKYGKAIAGTKVKTITGAWSFTPNGIDYQFQSTNPDFVLPDHITKLTPKNPIDYKMGGLFLTEVDAEQPSETTYVDKVNKVTWTFAGYDKEKIVVAKGRQTFLGSWVPTPNPEYVFKSSDARVPLPQNILGMLPSDEASYKVGDTIVAKQPAKESVVEEEKDYVWTFKGYDQKNATYNGKRVTFTGIWEVTPRPHHVSYAFVSETAGVDLPEFIQKKAPKDSSSYYNMQKVVPEEPTTKTYKDDVNDGTWTFTGYDAKSKIVKKADLTFTGKWAFKVNQYQAGYRFESATAGKDLPVAITALSPNDSVTYVNGAAVSAKQPAKTIYTDTVHDGTWTFKGYAANNAVVNKANVEFVGKWSFEANKYQTNYRFESATAGKQLPAEITGLTPSDSATYLNGVAVSAKQPIQTTYVDSANDGIWKFKRYIPAGAVVNKTNVTFVGQWEFRANKYQASYRFESATAGKDLPVAITALSPNDSVTYVNGAAVSAKQPAKTIYTDTVHDGTWTFKGYAANNAVVNKANVEFVGKWSFEANKYQTNYRFESATAGKQLPAEITGLTPSDSATYENGNTVSAQQPSQTTYTDPVNDGTWTFKGYDAASAVVNKTDVEFVGKWEFKANPTNAETYTPQVTEETIKVGETPDLTDNVTNLPSLPAGTKVVDITPAGQIDTTKPGTYSGTVRVDYPDGSSTEVPVPVNVLPAPVIETYKVTYRFESATVDNNLPTEVLSLLPQSGTYTTSSSAAIAFVPEAPMPVEVAVANGTWKFVGYEKVEEETSLTFIGKWTFEAKQAPSPQPQPAPQPVPPVTPEVKPDQETDDKAQTDQLVKPESKPVSNDKPAVPTPAGDKAKQATLPNTGSTSLISIEGATTSAILAGLGGLLLGRKREDD